MSGLVSVTIDGHRNCGIMVFQPRKVLAPKLACSKMTVIVLVREFEMNSLDTAWQDRRARTNAYVKKLYRINGQQIAPFTDKAPFTF